MSATSQGRRAFVSYAREDAEFAQRLATDLRAAGVELWLDSLSLVAGRDWDSEIENALSASDTLLLVLSPDAHGSANVRNELSYALDKHLSVVPLMHRTCQLPLRIARSHWIDFRSQYDRGLTEVIGHLTGVERERPRTGQPAVAAPPRRLVVLAVAGATLTFAAGAALWFNHRSKRSVSLEPYHLEILGSTAASRDRSMDTRTTLVFLNDMSIELVVRPEREVFEPTVAAVFAKSGSGESRRVHITTDSLGRGVHRLHGPIADTGLGAGEWRLAVVIARPGSMPASFEAAVDHVDADGYGSGYVVNLGQIAVRDRQAIQ